MASLGALPMADSPHPPEITEIEHQILRRLINTETEPLEWLNVERKLRGYLWRDPDCAVIFQAISRIKSAGVKNWREELPMQTTRMGFPVLDWNEFFERNSTNETDANLEELLIRLETQSARER